MFNTTHVKKRMHGLKLVADKFIRLTFDKSVRQRMRALWARKRHTDPDLNSLGDAYEQAFEQYLFVTKVPKQVVKIDREMARLKVSEHVPEQIKQLQRIAQKRQQPLSVIVEEALTAYLDKPENYLGSGHETKQKVERI